MVWNVRKCNQVKENKRFHNITSSKSSILELLKKKQKNILIANVYSVSRLVFIFFFLNRFKVEQKLDFKEALYSLNITEIFSGGCDLSGITGNMINNSYIIMLMCFLSNYVNWMILKLKEHLARENTYPVNKCHSHIELFVKKHSILHLSTFP